MDPFQYLNSRGHFKIDPGLDRMEHIMGMFKDPHLSIPAVHIGGTNGKGSTSSIVEAILSSFPLSIGTYTSPHLERITERIRIDRKEVDQEILRSMMSMVLDSLQLESVEDGPTYFELLTAASLLIMEKEGVDVNISEVGMGGRWDATNILEPQACAITSISMDHMEYLGDDPISITLEKCGIIKSSTPVVIGDVCSMLEERERCLRTILDVCTHNGCPVVLISDNDGVDKKKALLSSYGVPDWRIVSVEYSDVPDGTCASFKVQCPDGQGQREPKFELIDNVMNGDYKVPLIGAHQAYNLGIGIALSMIVPPFGIAHSKLKGGDISELSNLITGCVDSLIEEHSCENIIERIRTGLGTIDLKGRMERIMVDDKVIYLDGGHNIEAAKMISETIKTREKGKSVHLLLGMMEDKEAAEYISQLDMQDRHLGCAVLTKLPYDRSMSTLRLLEGMVRSGIECNTIHVREKLTDAIELWISGIDRNEIGLATGSFYLYGPVKEWLGSQKL